MVITPRQLNNFWEKVKKTDNCWLWMGSRFTTRNKESENAYGNIRLNHKNYKTHRIAWELYNGPIPHGLLVLHSCDNPPCVNPSHLWLGTAKDNAIDRANKSRGQFGTKVYNSKLNEGKVISILELYFNRKPRKEIANTFKVSKGTIQGIIEGRYWKHVST